jgi:hypothetical protein
MKNTAHFSTEKQLNAFVKKTGLKFAGACIDEEKEDEAGWVNLMRSQGKAVVWLDNYAAGKGAYLAFHKS